MLGFSGTARVRMKFVKTVRWVGSWIGMGVSALNLWESSLLEEEMERGFSCRTGSSMCSLHFGSKE